jgi:biopolymer transport protein ExbB
MASFPGDVDEFVISKVLRPAGYIKLQAIGQGPDQAKLISFSVDEETASWLNGYFAVILKSVTIDGWVVISILMIMAVISWAVMVDKARYLGKQINANNKFQQSFRELASDLTILDHQEVGTASSMGGKLTEDDLKALQDSSLYRIYHIGAVEIRHRFVENGKGHVRVLSAQSIAAIRAALDGGFARESQSLNRLMVLLTIAISGGPFLGLLGTVVGVMITFAAIAQSGDVNVNAIAPGIAAALVATVTGLGVAIPALFGYNYLISKIKDLSTDMQVFIDEFTTKMAEFYDGRPPQSPPLAAAE